MMKENGKWYTTGHIEITDPEQIAALDAEHGAPTEADAMPSAIPGETKADAFRRLANNRVKAALDKIRLVGNLSNKSSYDYTPEQIAKIEAALTSAVGDAMRRFKAEDQLRPRFTL